MLITKFVVPADEAADVGLKAINMDRLGKFVALTGKNGAGKTRIFAKLSDYIGKRNQHLPNISGYRENIKNLQNAIKQQTTSSSLAAWKQNILDLEKSVVLATERVFSTSTITFGVLHFVPKKLNLRDARNLTDLDRKREFERAMKPGLDASESSCFAYIQIILSRYWNATHPKTTQTKAEIDEIGDRYSQLVTLIEKLLKTELRQDRDGHATLFDKPLAEANLSDGQKVLIQLAVALHAQNAKLDNTVFLLDEPENHLHPSALIEFLDALADVAQKAQFWIATHSVPLLAHIANKEPMAIWYVEEGSAERAGNKPEKVLRGLLGNDAQIANLHSFCALPAQFAALNFAAECLLPPKTIGGGEGDPQAAQIGGILNLDPAKPQALLDYGAGKGRLLPGLDALASTDGMVLKDCLEYYAFDCSETDRHESEATIAGVYGNAVNRYFLGEDDFFSKKDDGSIDVVVMCNVLHEIPASAWTKLFRLQSLIFRALKDSGFLLIVEDQRIPTGEKAHQFGFLVFDTSHLRTLFGITEDDVKKRLFRTSDHRGDGRLKAHWIAKELLPRLTTDTRKTAIQQLSETAKREITRLRSASPDYKNGQLHGFWVQQFANASLVLEQF